MYLLVAHSFPDGLCTLRLPYNCNEPIPVTEVCRKVDETNLSHVHNTASIRIMFEDDPLLSDGDRYIPIQDPLGPSPFPTNKYMVT